MQRQKSDLIQEIEELEFDLGWLNRKIKSSFFNLMGSTMLQGMIVLFLIKTAIQNEIWATVGFFLVGTANVATMTESKRQWQELRFTKLQVLNRLIDLHEQLDVYRRTQNH